eukprot:scaffold15391_cov99-Skeletonema_marinoi.AAC.1
MASIRLLLMDPHIPSTAMGAGKASIRLLLMDLHISSSTMADEKEQQLREKIAFTTVADEKEQQLREKIASQKTHMANLPTLQSIVDETGFTSPETKARAQLIKELSDNEEQLELLLEYKRVAAVIRLQDELHPPQNSEDCPICLETIKHVNSTTIIRFFCCGGWICKQCSNERNAKRKAGGFDEMYRNKCPLCREKMIRGDNHEKAKFMALEHSNKGRAWAKSQIGSAYMGGMSGLPLDREKGVQFFKEAADQRDPDGLLELAVAYNIGYTGVLERDESKYLYYLGEAADLGHPRAQRLLALTHDDECNCEKGYLHYITLAASNGDYKAGVSLGHSYIFAQHGLTKSYTLGKHYSDPEKYSTEAEEGNPRAAFNLSISLYHLVDERFEGIIEIPGYSPIPKSLFWARIAMKKGSTETAGIATNLISILENDAKSHCANCRKEAENSSLKRCVRCLGAWYCGKECQVQHWKNGHKFDCITSK